MDYRLSLLLALTLLFSSCGPETPPDDDDSAGDDDDSAGDDDDDDSAGDDDDDDSAGDDDDSASAGLQVEDADAFCGPEPEPLPQDNLMLNVVGPGEISVIQWNYSEGCCPQIEVDVVEDLSSSTLSVSYNLFDDVCDCICSLDISYEVTGIPAGQWTLALPNGVSRNFTVN